MSYHLTLPKIIKVRCQKMQYHLALCSYSSLPPSGPLHYHTRSLRRSIRLPNVNKTLNCCLKEQSGDSTRASLKTTWPTIGVSLFGSGFVLGPLIDGLHSRVNLVVYQNGSLNIGPLHSNIWVPFLLGLFYCIVGLLQLYLDERASPNLNTEGSFVKTAISLMSLVLFIELSARLYNASVSPNIEAYTLFAAAEFIWFLADRTWLGFALACVVGLACPLAEIPLIKYFHLWYYPQANVQIFGEGLVSWTITCYFVYTFFLINFSRWLNSVFSAAERKD